MSVPSTKKRVHSRTLTLSLSTPPLPLLLYSLGSRLQEWHLAAFLQTDVARLCEYQSGRRPRGSCAIRLFASTTSPAHQTSVVGPLRGRNRSPRSPSIICPLSSLARILKGSLVQYHAQARARKAAQRTMIPTNIYLTGPMRPTTINHVSVLHILRLNYIDNQLSEAVATLTRLGS